MYVLSRYFTFCMPPMAFLSKISFIFLENLIRFFSWTIAKYFCVGHSFFFLWLTLLVKPKPRNWDFSHACSILVLSLLTFRNSFFSTYFVTFSSICSAAFLLPHIMTMSSAYLTNLIPLLSSSW